MRRRIKRRPPPGNLRCTATTGSGRRCCNRRQGDMLYCTFHVGLLGSDVEVNKSMIELEGETWRNDD